MKDRTVPVILAVLVAIVVGVVWLIATADATSEASSIVAGVMDDSAALLDALDGVTVSDALRHAGGNSSEALLAMVMATRWRRMLAGEIVPDPGERIPEPVREVLERRGVL